MVVVKVKMLVTQFCLTLVTYWSEVCQVPVSTELSRKKYWSGRPSPSPGNLPNPGFEHWSPTLWAYYLSSEPLGTPSSGDNYCLYMTEFSSVVQSCLNLCNPMDCNTPRLLCPSPTPRGCSNSWPLSWWCHPTISSSVTPFFCLQSFPASGSFSVSQLFASGGQNIGASASVLPMNIQDWFPLGLTALISLLSKGLSRVFSSTTVWNC